MTIDIHNKENKKIDTMELPASLFGIRWNPNTVTQIISIYLANKRRAIAHTKDRGEVRGGGKKPWKQKHTGQARHGSRRSPIWVGGGVTFGPRNEKDFSRKANKKMKRVALLSALSKKYKDQELMVVDTLEFKEEKTKQLAGVIKVFFGSRKKMGLIPSREHYKTMVRIGKNMPQVNVLNPASLHAYNIVTPKHILFEKEALQEFIKTNNKENNI